MKMKIILMGQRNRASPTWEYYLLGCVGRYVQAWHMKGSMLCWVFVQSNSAINQVCMLRLHHRYLIEFIYTLYGKTDYKIVHVHVVSYKIVLYTTGISCMRNVHETFTLRNATPTHKRECYGVPTDGSSSKSPTLKAADSCQNKTGVTVLLWQCLLLCS